MGIVNGVNDSAWVRLSMERPAKVHGLAFDVPKYVCEMKTIYGFGVCQDASLQADSDEADKPPPLPIHARGPTLPSPNFTYYLRQEKTRYGLSTASLNNIATLYVRKKIIETLTGRVCGCAGLWIVHVDSSIEILGRWDPRDKHSISKLYDSSDGVLKTVTFHMAKAEMATHVQNITVGVTDNPWDYPPIDASLVVPINPPNHPWNCEPGEYPMTIINTRLFDCSQDNQVRVLLTLFLLLDSKLLFLTMSAKRVAWWFTFDHDDIGRDHGITAMQFEEDADLYFGEQYEAVQIE